jgi:hypothetical protein
MGIVVYDREQETTSTTGTGSVTLLGAVTGYQSFAVVGNGGQTYYCIADQGGANWEVGIGTYSTTGPSLARTTVLASSNSGSLVNFTSGTKTVFITYPAEKNVTTDSIYTDHAFSGTYNGDGAVLDYVTGEGRISVGPADNLTFYNGGVGTTPMASFNRYGAFGVGSGLNFGTTGQVLQSNGTSAPPSWSSSSAASIDQAYFLSFMMG